MSTIRVEVVDLGKLEADSSGALAPAAALRLYGPVSLPSDPIFRIDPIDDALLFDESGGWPAGPRRPIEIRHGDGHVDLMLGADVLESPLLETGTPVVVEVLGTPASAELIWPDIAVRGVRPRRPVILTEKLREAERREQEAAARAAIEEIEAAKRLAAEEAEAKKREAAEIAARRQRQFDEQVQRVANGDVEPGAVAVSRRRRASLVALDGGATAGGADHLRLVTSTEMALTPAAKPTLPVATEKAVPGGVLSGARAWFAFAAGLASALALVAGLMAWRLLPFSASNDAQMTPDIALAAARSNGSLRSILATTGTSPRGRAASGIDATTALALADRHLHGADLPRDQGEASFWLRHALSLPLDPETMRWALTQLGTLHASPDGFEPDYAKARLLWEVAGALGDPVAMCFNASLYEYGLGIPKHRQLAHALYTRAQNAGGCPGLDEALARTK